MDRIQNNDYSLIEKLGAITRPQPLHHRAYGSVHGGSQGHSNFEMLLLEAQQPQVSKALVRYREVDRTSCGATPRPRSSPRCSGSFRPVYSKRHQFLEASPRRPRRAPEYDSEPTPYSGAQPLDPAFDSHQTVVVNPPPQLGIQPLGRNRQIVAASPAEYRTEVLFEAFHRLRCDLESWLPIRRDAKPEKLPLPRACHGTVGPIDLQMEPSVKVWSPAHSVAGLLGDDPAPCQGPRGCKSLRSKL